LRDAFLTVPLFLPAIAVWLLVGLVANGALARSLGVSRPHALALVLSLAIILSATLTPQWEALQDGATGLAICDLSRTWLAPLRDYVHFGDTGGNVLMFMPLGAVLSLMPRSRNQVVLILAAIVLPFAIETTQLFLTFLDRGCESADVVDNLLGVLVGLAIGFGARWLLVRWRQGLRPRP
jgi:VanZ family protein